MWFRAREMRGVRCGYCERVSLLWGSPQTNMLKKKKCLHPPCLKAHVGLDPKTPEV